MSDAAPAMAGSGSVSGQANAPLDATAQFLTFEPGMYAVDFHAERSTPTNVGLAMPCARLDTLPPSTALPGRAVVSLMADGGWLRDGDMPAFIRVAGGTAGVLLTIYKGTGGMPSPELRIRYIRDDLQFQRVPPTAEAAAAPAATVPAAPAALAPPTLAPQAGLGEGAVALQLLVHAQERGDIAAAAGAWAGLPGSQKLLEGFAVTPTADPLSGIGMETLEYQAILGDGWNTPWFAAGEFCGSRGLALPILGLRMRLTGEAAARYSCVYWGSFLGRGEIGPIADGEACEADGEPMDALRVSIVRRTLDDIVRRTLDDIVRRTPDDAPPAVDIGAAPPHVAAPAAPPASPERRRRRPRE